MTCLVSRHQQRELAVRLAHTLQALVQRADPVVTVADVFEQLFLQVDVTGAQLQVCITVAYLVRTWEKDVFVVMVSIKSYHSS